LRRSQIIGIGSAVPQKVLTNFDLERMVDTSDEWIRTRTGIERRHIASDSETTGTLGAGAALAALRDAGVGPEEVDLILVCTLLPEMLFPSTGCFVQEAIGASNAAAMDLSAACSGFIYGLSVADAFISSGKYRYVLVIGSETMSKVVDWSDRNTCVLFGDGAGAVLLGPSSDDERGVISTYIRSDGSQAGLLFLPGGGSRHPSSPDTVKDGLHYIKMQGPELFKAAVNSMGDALLKVLETSGISGEDVDLFIPHQANIRIIQAVAKKANIPMDKVYVNLQEYGNTSAASIPIAMDEAKRGRMLKEGDVVAMVAFGGGLTWGSAVVRM